VVAAPVSAVVVRAMLLASSVATSAAQPVAAGNSVIE